MTQNEAEGLIHRLEASFDKRLQPDTYSEYVCALLPYTRITCETAIIELIHSTKFFPKIAELLEAIRLKQAPPTTNNGPDVWKTSRGRYLVWRQQQIDNMSREEYAMMCSDESYRAVLERNWHTIWDSQVKKGIYLDECFHTKALPPWINEAINKIRQANKPGEALNQAIGQAVKKV